MIRPAMQGPVHCNWLYVYHIFSVPFWSGLSGKSPWDLFAYCGISKHRHCQFKWAYEWAQCFLSQCMWINQILSSCHHHNHQTWKKCGTCCKRRGAGFALLRLVVARWGERLALLSCDGNISYRVKGIRSKNLMFGSSMKSYGFSGCLRLFDGFCHLVTPDQSQNCSNGSDLGIGIIRWHIFTTKFDPSLHHKTVSMRESRDVCRVYHLLSAWCLVRFTTWRSLSMFLSPVSASIHEGHAASNTRRCQNHAMGFSDEQWGSEVIFSGFIWLLAPSQSGGNHLDLPETWNLGSFQMEVAWSSSATSGWSRAKGKTRITWSNI